MRTYKVHLRWEMVSEAWSEVQAESYQEAVRKAGELAASLTISPSRALDWKRIRDHYSAAVVDKDAPRKPLNLSGEWMNDPPEAK